MLAGHSFGGFISGHYSVMYPERVEHLVLLSPAGVQELNEKHSGLESLE